MNHPCAVLAAIVAVLTALTPSSRAADPAEPGATRPGTAVTVPAAQGNAARRAANPESPAAPAVRVESFAPQGTTRQVLQATARFTVPMVALGDPWLKDPFTVQCPAKGKGRWADTRNWIYDFEDPSDYLPAGLSCRFTLVEGLKALDGRSVGGTRAFTFDTGGPAIVASMPRERNEIDEDQIFLLKIDAQATVESIQRHAYCVAQGIAERIPMRVLVGAEREAVLEQSTALGYVYSSMLYGRGRVPAMAPNVRETARTDAERTVVVATCGRPLPASSEVKLVWGAGIAAASGLATRQDQKFAFRVRAPFTVRVECSRTNSDAGCIPFRPILLQFTAPVPRAKASQAYLEDADGKRYLPAAVREDLPTVEQVRFAGPFPAAGTLSVHLPPDVRDDADRALQNAGRFPLRLEIDEYPPLAKFSGNFGILETREGGILPVTLRNLEVDLPAREAAIPGRIFTAANDAVRVSQWLRRVEKANERRGEWVEDKKNGGHWRDLTGDTSVLGAADVTRSFSVAKATGKQPAEVVGIPLGKPGFYVVELESRVLGAALLGRDRTRYVSTAALVTNLSVHLLWGRERSQVWVTSLDEGRPVADAEVEIRDHCHGTLKWSGKTDAQGLARIDSALGPQVVHGDWCEGEQQPLIAVARKGEDFSFTLSSWSDGIAPHDFGLSSDWDGPDIYHTVLDRPLFRAGETVSMKHFIRRHATSGVQIAEQLPATRKVKIAHRGSEQRYEVSVPFDAGGIAQQQWQIPKDAKLGDYAITIEDSAKVERNAGTFKVEEYRLPTMRATVQGQARALVNAREASVDLHVAYLSGGGAGGLPVTVRSLIERAPLHFADYEDFSFGGAPVVEGRTRPGWHYDYAAGQPPGDALKARVMPLTLDAQGAARVTIADLPVVTVSSQLVAELEYPDPNGELLTTATRVRLLPSELSVGIRRDGWVASEKHLQFRVVVLDLDAKPVAKQRVQTALYQVGSYGYRKRLIGGFYAYDQVNETTRLEPTCSGTTDAKGLLLCKLAPGVSGQVVLRAETRDTRGNVSGATTTIWVAGQDDWWFGGTTGDRMDVLPENKEYEPGDVARLQVRMPFRSATALVSVEREGVIESFVKKLSGRAPVVEIPIKDAYAPNVYVSVLALRGRVARSERSRAERAREPDITGLVDLNKPAYRLGIAGIRVGWRPHRVDVRVTPERSTYRVREQAAVKVRVTRADGKALPPGSEIALAAVDEALLELAPNASWALLDAMMNERGLDVVTSTAQMQVVGRRHYGRKAVPHGGGGGRERARELFESLLLWKPRLELDADGEGSVIVPLNDSLSSFRIVAIAHGGAQLFGTGSASIATTQDLVLLSGLPPLVREGDRFAATFTVRNATSEAMQVELTARTTPALGAPLQPLRIEIPGGQARDVSWPASAPIGAPQLQWTVSARQSDGGGATDRITVTESVIPAHPVRTYQATLAQAEGPLAIPVERPRAALPGRGGLEVSLSARLAGNLDGVRKYMSEYRYTCLEQNTSRAVALRDRNRWDRLMEQLPAYMDDDGLLRYFPTDRLAGDDVLTSYVLAIAHEAGWEIPEPSRQRLLEALVRFVDGRIVRGSALPTADLAIRKLAAIEALSRFDSAKVEMLDSLTIEPNLWPTSAVIDWLGILRRTPKIAGTAEKRRVAENVLRARLNFQGSTLGFSTGDRDDLWWLMISQDSNALRLMLAVLDVPAWREDLPRLGRGALGRQQRGHWSTTVANAWGVLAMEKFSAKFEAQPLAGPTIVSYDATTRTLQWPRADNTASVDFPWSKQPAAGTLQVNHTGSGKPWIMVRANAAWPLDKPVSTGFRITRSVSPVEQKVAGRWTRGDVARVRVSVDAQSEMTWVVVEDPVPAGSTLLGSGLGGQSQILQSGERREGWAWPVFEERRFDSFRQYYRFVPKGELMLEYTVRFNNPGTFQLPATRVEAMYAPEMLGELPNANVTVEAAP